MSEFEFSDYTLTERLRETRLYHGDWPPLGLGVGDKLPNMTYINCQQVDDEPGTDYRTCQIENVCFNLNDHSLIVLKGAQPSCPVVNITGPRNLFETVFFYEDRYTDALTFKEDLILTISTPTILLSRSMTKNLYHNLHDNVLPMLQLVASSKTLRHANNRLVLAFDRGDVADGRELYNALGTVINLRAISSFNNSQARKAAAVCFQQIFAGTPRKTLWFQPSYKTRLFGPETLFSPSVIGKNIQVMAQRLKQHFGIDEPANLDLRPLYLAILHKTPLPAEFPPRFIVIFRRTRYRRLQNESELLHQLNVEFPSVSVLIINEEEHSLVQIVRLISSSIALIGAHGALFGLAIFLPRGAMIFEILPFAVYTDIAGHYKTLASLPYLRLHYRNSMSSEINSHTEAIFSALIPSYQDGGLSNKRVPVFRGMHHPFLHYRMVQDVVANVELIIQGLKDMMLDEINRAAKNKALF